MSLMSLKRGITPSRTRAARWIEAQLARVRPGMSAEVKIDGLPDASIAGEVGYISSVAEFTPKPVQTEELRTSLVYEVRVLVKDPDDQLRLGMPATVRLVP
jgi:HlyD family secretion protein